MSTAPQGTTYVLGHADAEVQRLLLQGRLYDHHTEHALRLAGLRVLLGPVELVQPAHRCDRGQHEVAQLPHEIACGTAGFRSGDIAARDGEEVLGLDAGDIADVCGRRAHLPGSLAVLGKVVTQAGLEEPIGAEPFGVDAHGAHEHPRRNVDVTHPPAQRCTDRIGDLGPREQRRSGGPVGAAVVTVGVEQRADGDPRDVFVGGRRVSAHPGRCRQHPELGGHGDQLQVVVGEVTRIDGHMRRVGQQLEQLVGQPGLPRHQRRMLRAGQPLAKRHHRFHA
ncbi:hypothetical protein A5646_04455 [Mycobacterium sp. 1245499.0]|nr:hypothetical protein A5646_04455 [Mycobacterium sp. 1245499.0]